MNYFQLYSITFWDYILTPFYLLIITLISYAVVRKKLQNNRNINIICRGCMPALSVRLLWV